MDLFTAIQTRRSIGKVKQDAIPRKLLEQILEAAVWAPNHHYTEPWKFFVMSGDGRKRLGLAYAEIAAEELGGAEAMNDDMRAAVKKAEEKAYRSPVVIAVAVEPSEQPKVFEIEEIAAVNAAIQNLLLAAHALGLGAVWRSGAPCYHPKMREAFGVSDKGRMLGFVYVGYPDMAVPDGKRTPASHKTEWIDTF